MGIIYLTAGHEVINGVGTGAHSPHGDEAVLAQKMVQDLTYALQQEGLAVVNDVNTSKLTEVIKWLNEVITDKDFIVDVHFNAGPELATGCEVIVPDIASSKELTMAASICASISSSLAIRNRGVKRERDTARKTIGILRYPNKACNVLIETCFLSNKADMEAFNASYSSLIKNLSTTITGQVK